MPSYSRDCFKSFLDFSSSFLLPFAVKPTISNPMPMGAPPQNQSINLINNFNNNYRNQTSGFPHCVAVYDFEAENAGELSFKVSFNSKKCKSDKKWLCFNGNFGYFQ